MTISTIYRGVQGNSSAQFAIGDAFTTAQNNDDSLNITKPERITNVAALRLLDKTKINSAETNGYYTAGDGGHGEYWYDAADTISTDNGGSVIVAVDGARWKLRVSDTVNVKQFGAVGNGIVDDTASILAAVLAAAGGKVYFPKGTYLISAEIPLNVIGLQFVGESRFTTIIKQNTLGAKILNISQMFCGVSGLSFFYNGTPTSGATAINVTGSYATLEDFVIRSCHIGVEFNDCVAGKLSNYEILDYEIIGLHLQNVNDVFSHSFIFNAGNTTRGALGGIRLTDKVEAFVATDGDVLMGQYSLTTVANVNGLGTRPAYNNFTNVFFDSSTLGSVIADLVETEFVGCWFSGGRSGVGSPGVSISTSDSVRFTNTRFFNCGGDGCVVNASTKNVFFTACDFESNSVTAGAGGAHGMSIAAGMQGLVVNSCKFGNGLYTGQQGYGLFIDTGADKFSISNNVFDGNLTGSISDNTVSTAEKKLSGNIGHTDAVISTYIPVVTGSSTAGTASYSLQEGYSENITDDLVYFSASCTYTGHTGTGGTRVSLPFSAANFGARVAISVFVENEAFGADKVVQGFIGSSGQTAVLRAVDPLGGGNVEFFDSAGTIHVSGTYRKA